MIYTRISQDDGRPALRRRFDEPRGPIPAPPAIPEDTPVVRPVAGRCDVTGHLPDGSGACLYCDEEAS